MGEEEERGVKVTTDPLEHDDQSKERAAHVHKCVGEKYRDTMEAMKEKPQVSKRLT